MHLWCRDKLEYRVQAKWGPNLTMEVTCLEGIYCLLGRLLAKRQEDTGRPSPVRRLTTVAPEATVCRSTILWHWLAFFIESQNRKKTEEKAASLCARHTLPKIRTTYFGHIGTSDSRSWTSNRNGWENFKLNMEEIGPGMVKAAPQTVETGLIWQMLDQVRQKPN